MYLLEKLITTPRPFNGGYHYRRAALGWGEVIASLSLDDNRVFCEGRRGPRRFSNPKTLPKVRATPISGKKSARNILESCLKEKELLIKTCPL